MTTHSIHRPSCVYITPLDRIDARWNADERGYAVMSITRTVYSQPQKGVSQFMRSQPIESVSDLDEAAAERLMDDIVCQIAHYNRLMGQNIISDLPRLTLIEDRAMLVGEAA